MNIQEFINAAVEAAWAIVDPVLNPHHQSRPYKCHSWGPKEADVLIAARLSSMQASAALWSR